MNELTADIARQLLTYNHESGIARWTGEGKSRKAVAGKEAGTIARNGYPTIGLLGKKYRLHRIVWLITHGEWPEEIDHINGIRTDNRLCNLRSVTRRDNLRNRRIGSANTSGVMGVYWEKDRNKWNAQIARNMKSNHLGRFDNLFDAVCARKSAEIEYGFHPNHGRT